MEFPRDYGRLSKVTNHLLVVVSYFAIGVVGSLCAMAQQADPAGLENASPAWVDSWMLEINSQVEMATSAYELSDSQVADLRAELVSRIPIQARFEETEIAKLQEMSGKILIDGSADDSPEAIAVISQLRRVTTESPLCPDQVVRHIESSLPPEIAEGGSTRFHDLLNRRTLQQNAKDNDLDQRSALSVELSEAQVASTPQLATLGNPLPNGNKLAEVAPEAVGRVGGDTDPSVPVKPNAGVAEHPVQTDAIAIGGAANPAMQNRTTRDINEVVAVADPILAGPAKPTRDTKDSISTNRTAKTDAARIGGKVQVSPVTDAQSAAPLGNSGRDVNRHRSSRSVPASVEPVRLQAAPPLDDWDKYVDTTCKKFGFTDAQVIKAQSILKDLRNRAAAYRSSRNEDFAAAERIVDAKAKADRNKDLSAPIDAFFEELKQRLDNLATLEQRAKAATSATTGKK